MIAAGRRVEHLEVLKSELKGLETRLSYDLTRIDLGSILDRITKDRKDRSGSS